MGSPLTKTAIMEFAIDLVADMEYQEKIKQFKVLQKLGSLETPSDAWYRGFMNCFSDELTRSVTTVKDTKQNTSITKENFINMYENVY